MDLKDIKKKIDDVEDKIPDEVKQKAKELATKENIEKVKATPHNHRLPPLPHICLQIFRHIAQKLLEIRQYSCVVSIQSDEKSDYASARQ